MKMHNLQLFWFVLFGISMAFFESSVVVYLRSLYYPQGFSFPLETLEPHIAVTEFFRELFSLVMIMSVALIATRNFLQRFANFLFIFAVWDIFYYVSLKLLLNWPASFLTWDILFLVPFPWAGPVLTPILISCIMILFAVTIRYFNRISHYQMYLELREWLVMLAGAFLVFVSFIWDFVTYLLKHFTTRAETIHELMNELELHMRNYIPDGFNWWIYALGIIFIFAALFMIYRRNQLMYRKY